MCVTVLTQIVQPVPVVEKRLAKLVTTDESQLLGFLGGFQTKLSAASQNSYPHAALMAVVPFPTQVVRRHPAPVIGALNAV